MIYRGTTPTVMVDVDGVDLTGWTTWVSVRSGRTSLDLTGARVTTEPRDGGCTVAVTLTQEETLRMRDGDSVRIQVRAVSALGEAVATSVATESVGGILMDGEVAHA